MPTARKPLALILALLVSLAIPQVAFAADPLAAGGSETVLHAQDSGGYTWRTDIQGDKFKDFESPDGLVGVYNITAGSAPTTPTVERYPSTASPPRASRSGRAAR